MGRLIQRLAEMTGSTGVCAAILAAFPVWSCVVHDAAGQELPLTHFTTETERITLPSATVAGVYQDRIGYVWMQLYSSGLARYDGNVLEMFDVGDGLRDLNVWRADEDGTGRLWVASGAGLVASAEPLTAYGPGERPRFVAAIDAIPLAGGRIRPNALDVDAAGRVWAGTSSAGVIRYTTSLEEGMRVDTFAIPPASSNEPSDVRALLVGRDGSMWLATADGRVVVARADGRIGAVEWAPGGPQSYVSTFFEAPNGTVWAGANTGEVYRTDGEPRLRPVGRPVQHNILSFFADGDGLLWVNSEGGGIAQIRRPSGMLHRTLGRRNGLLGESVFSVMADREGNLWVAQVGGLSRLRYNFRAFQNYTADVRGGARPNLPSRSVSAVAIGTGEGSTCDVWAGTSEGGVACIRDGAGAFSIDQPQGLWSSWVNALLEDESGDLWIGTTKGIQRATFGSGRAPGSSVRLSDAWTGSIFSAKRLEMKEDDRGLAQVESLWFTAYGNLYVRVKGEWFVFGADDGLPQTRLLSVAFDSAGRLWVASQGQGVFRSTHPLTYVDLVAGASGASGPSAASDVDGRSEREAAGLRERIVAGVLFEQVWSAAVGAGSNEANGLLARGSEMWVATAQGVFVLEAEAVRTIARVSEESGLGSNFTMALASDADGGSIWAGTNVGLAEIDAAERRVKRNVTKRDGLVDSEVWYTGSVVVDDQGSVYFGTANGLSVYRPDLDAPASVAPVVVIRRADYHETATSNEFTADYAALTFSDERDVVYRTRLVGFEADWSAEHAETRTRYTNLPAVFVSRAYTLEVAARGGAGIWSSQPATFTFRVAPPSWLQWWAFLCYGVILALGVFAVDRYQRSRLLRKEREAARMREAELRAETALARSATAEAEAKALHAENERQVIELEKARELEVAYGLVQQKNEESERLLLNILPASVAERLRKGDSTIADLHADVTILFSDLVGFTDLASRMSPEALVQMLNVLFSRFDRLALDMGVEKIKTIGDAYMAVAGLPERRIDHAVVMSGMALEMMSIVRAFNHEVGQDLALRIGLHSGPVTAGVIGMHKFAYDVWGDAVNTAARMESHGIPGRIQVSESTGLLIQHAFELEERGSVDVKGKGRMRTYLLVDPLAAAVRTVTVGGGADSVTGPVPHAQRDDP